MSGLLSPEGGEGGLGSFRSLSDLSSLGPVRPLINFDFEIDRRSRSYITKTIMVTINALTQVALPVKQLQQLQSKAGAQTRQRGDHDNGRAGNGEDDYHDIVETSTTIIIDRDHGPPS